MALLMPSNHIVELVSAGDISQKQMADNINAFRLDRNSEGSTYQIVLPWLIIDLDLLEVMLLMCAHSACIVYQKPENNTDVKDVKLGCDGVVSAMTMLTMIII